LVGIFESLCFTAFKNPNYSSYTRRETRTESHGSLSDDKLIQSFVP